MAEITNLHPVTPAVVNQDPSEEPKVIRIAKLALILADKETQPIDKRLCVKLSVRQGIITEEEASQLLSSIPVLEEFMADPEDSKEDK